MRLVALATLTVFALLGSPAARAEHSDATPGDPASSRLAIRVVEGDWGRASPKDIEAVLYSAAAELWAHVADRKPLAIVVVPVAGHPRALYEKTRSGEYVVGLSARDRRWSQFAYQFAHELCHLLANFDQRMSDAGAPLTRHQWFEETLCEAAALFTLRRMAVTWESSPPFAHWRSYAPWLREFADLTLAAEPTRGAHAAALASWFAANRQTLAHDPYARELNDVCAAALLPLFEAEPEQWNAVRYLNREGSAAAATFPDYLQRWHRSAPERHRRLIEELAAAFGLARPGSRTGVALAGAPSAATR
jgi:hypothetical protein